MRHFRPDWRHVTLHLVTGAPHPADLDVPLDELTVAQRVRRVRRYGPNGKLSHERLAQLLGTSRQTVIAWEKGRGISDEYREKLAAYSGLDADWFKADEDELRPSLPDLAVRLEALEATVDQILELNETSFEAIHATLARLEARLDALAAPGGRRSRGAM